MNFSVSTFMTRLRMEEPAPPWSLTAAWGLVGVYVVARIFIAPLLVTALVPQDSTAVGISPAVRNAWYIVAGLAALLAAVLVVRRTAPESPVRALRLAESRDSLWLVALFSLGAAIVVDLLPLLFQARFLLPHLLGLNSATALTWIAVGLFTLVVGPLAAGVVMTGVLYPAAAVRWGGLRAILMTALAFALVQVLDDPANLLLWLESGLTGLYLGGVRAHQGSTLAAVIAGVMFGVFAIFKVLFVA